MSNLSDLRREYVQPEFTIEDAADDPFEQFRNWFEDAQEAELTDPNAVTLATAAPNAAPSARIMLLKGLDERGFIFYTNYDSRKGLELDQNPQAALVFSWAPLDRQVRVEGTVDRLPEEESTDYFQSRPRGSQLGAWASPQSRVVESRGGLERKLEEAREQYGEDEPIPRPPGWGGYVLDPRQIEFWQGRPNRLHDRLRYRREEGNEQWTVNRLAP